MIWTSIRSGRTGSTLEVKAMSAAARSTTCAACELLLLFGRRPDRQGRSVFPQSTAPFVKIRWGFGLRSGAREIMISLRVADQQARSEWPPAHGDFLRAEINAPRRRGGNAGNGDSRLRRANPPRNLHGWQQWVLR